MTSAGSWGSSGYSASAGATRGGWDMMPPQQASSHYQSMEGGHGINGRLSYGFYWKCEECEEGEFFGIILYLMGLNKAVRLVFVVNACVF